MGALDGIKVLDFSRLAPGPYCSMLLADMGADVVRVDRSPPEPISSLEQTVARGKRTIALDLKRPEGQEVALRVAAASDVVLDGFRPGTMERLGLGPTQVHAANPRVVYARLTGWGQTGPLAMRAGHDLNYIAMSGVLGSIGHMDGPPAIPVNLLGDFAGGSLFCALGIVAALLERERSGLGQVIDAAMIDGSASLTTFFQDAIADGSIGPRGTNYLDGGYHFYNVYETSDGKWLSVGPLEPKFYAEMLNVLNLDPQLVEKQFDLTHEAEMRAQLVKIFATKTRDEWEAAFEGRDACVFPVLEPHEAPNHVANSARDTHSTPAPRFSRTASHASSESPEPGQHTREVLAEVGVTPEEIDALIEANVAWQT